LLRPNLIVSNKRLQRIPVTVSASCTRKKGDLHFHDYTHIWYVLAGQLLHTVNGTVYKQLPGSCVVVSPFTSHKIDLTVSDETPVVVDISFQDSFLLNRGYRFFSIQNRFEEHKIPVYRQLIDDDKEKADVLMREVLLEFSKKHNMSFDKIAALATDFLRILCFERAIDDDFTLIQERVDLIMDAINYISQHLDKKITIDELCSISAMSRRMFTDNFKAITGMTVSQFLLSVRITRAQNLLMLTNKSINEIAVECGLYDRSRLIHAFTDYCGMSPAKFREATKQIGLAGEKSFEDKWGWLFDEK